MNTPRPREPLHNPQPPRFADGIVPTLVESYMNGASGAGPAEEARQLFDAIEAIEREQEVRTLHHLLEEAEELEELIQQRALKREWKSAQVLMTNYLVGFSTAPLVPIVVLLSERQKEMLAKVNDGGAEAVEFCLAFGGEAKAIIRTALDRLLLDATAHGRRDVRIVKGEQATVIEKEEKEALRDARVFSAAKRLFDNRLGTVDAPVHRILGRVGLWADLGAAIYGEDDVHVRVLRNPEGSVDPKG